MSSLRTDSNADVEALRAELRKNGHDLLLAARYGKGLLEENSRYQRDMESAQEERDALKEALESQKYESQKALSEARQVAELHVAELEQQLDSVRSTLEKERAATSAVKVEYQRIVDQLKAENNQLKEELNKVTEDKQLLDNQLQHANQRLSECEEHSTKLMQEISGLQKQMNQVKENNSTLEENVGTLVHTCDQLTDELENSREEVEDLENRCKLEKEELMTTIKELEDTQDQLKQLQIQYEQQSMVVLQLSPNASMTSRMSLFDEIYSSHGSFSFDNELSENGGNQDEMLSVYSENDAPDKLCMDLSPILDRRRSADVSPSADTSSMLPVPRWTVTSDSKCSKCEDLEKQLVKNKEELENVTKQLIIAVQQKFKLQEQIEAWQSDMAQMVDKQVKSNLHKAQRRASKSARRKSNRTHDSDEHQGITYHLTKQPWIF